MSQHVCERFCEVAAACAKYEKIITEMQARICRLIEEKAEIEDCVEILEAIRDQALIVHATGSATGNDQRTSVDRDQLSKLGLMVRESCKVIPGRKR